MQIQIKVINVEIEDKGKYKMAEVTYKDINQNKTASKKLMSFTFPSVYAAITSGQGKTFTVNMNKNDKGYWDWIEVVDGEAPAASKTSTSSTTASVGKSSYETAEERALRQVYIIRQSSLSNAVAHLNHVKKSYNMEELLTTAKQLESFVFGKELNLTTDTLDDLPEDVAF